VPDGTANPQPCPHRRRAAVPNPAYKGLGDPDDDDEDDEPDPF
jgi:hypothetical protein